MANISFWRGTLAAFNAKLNGGLEDGRIYFVTDAGNESIYMGKSTSAATLMSPKRLTALTAATNDAESTATAKAIVDFVKAQVDGAFADGSAYATAIAGLQSSIDALNSVTEGYTGKGAIKTAVDAKLAKSTYDTAMAGITGTVANTIDAKVKAAKDTIDAYTVGGVAIKNNPTLETMGVTGAISTAKGEAIAAAQAMTVNTKSFGTGNSVTLTATDIKLSDNSKTVEKELEDIRTIASAAMTFKGVVDTENDLPTTGIENGDIYYVKADDTEYVYITDSDYGTAGWEALGGYVKADVYTKTETDDLLADKVDNTVTVNGHALTGKVSVTASDVGAYTVAEVDAAIAADVKAAKDAINAYTVNGQAISSSPMLTGADIAVSSTDTTKVDAKFAEKVNTTTTVNGKALSANITLYGDDITLSANAISGITHTTISNATNVTDAIIALDEALSEVTGGGSGDGGSLAKKMNKVEGGVTNNIVTLTSAGDAQDSGFSAGTTTLGTGSKVLATESAVSTELAKKVNNTVTVNGKALNGNITLAAADISDVYSKTEVDDAIAAAALVWEEA